MKRTGNLYKHIISLDNLYLASKKAQKGKIKHKDVISWNKNLDNNILELNRSLSNETYKVPEYSVFTIYEPKERLISKLPFRDRVVHHAILNYIEPILTNCFITQSYSCIKGRGIHKCLRDLTNGLKDRGNTQFCLKLDVRKFYPSIDHDILKKLLRTKFKDLQLLVLFDKIIDSCQGIPLGNYTSQWFGNFYLNSFDHWLKETKKIKYYFRYCDDIVILGSNKTDLHDLRARIQSYLLTIGLELSNYQVFPVSSRGIDFVGYVSHHTHIKLRKGIKVRLKKMLLNRKNDKSIASYIGWTIHANCRNLENKLFTTN